MIPALSFLSGTKDTNVIGLDGLRAVCQAVGAPEGSSASTDNNSSWGSGLPVVAIGGVSGANAPDTIRAGCAGGLALVTSGPGRAGVLCQAKGALRALPC